MNLTRILVCTYEGWHVVFWFFRRLKCSLHSKILIFKVLALNYLLLPLNKCSQSKVFAVFSPLNTIERGRTRSGKKDNFLVFTHHNQTWRSYKYVCSNKTMCKFFFAVFVQISCLDTEWIRNLEGAFKECSGVFIVTFLK